MSVQHDKEKCVIVKFENNKCTDNTGGWNNMSSICLCILLFIIIAFIMLKNDLYSYVTKLVTVTKTTQ
jgi:hypothetical protein